MFGITKHPSPQTTKPNPIEFQPNLRREASLSTQGTKPQTTFRTTNRMPWNCNYFFGINIPRRYEVPHPLNRLHQRNRPRVNKHTIKDTLHQKHFSHNREMNLFSSGHFQTNFVISNGLQMNNSWFPLK